MYRLRFLPALLAGVLAGCQRSRPIHASAALPAPGEFVPAFAFREVRVAPPGRDSVRSADLRGAPTILALWSTYCPHQGPAMAALARLAAQYRPAGVRVVVLADDAGTPKLRQALDTLSWARDVDQVGTAGGRLDRYFDRAATAPERATYRVEFVLPSFLLLDAEGRVVRRVMGPAEVPFRPALDSLLAAPPRRVRPNGALKLTGLALGGGPRLPAGIAIRHHWRPPHGPAA